VIRPRALGAVDQERAHQLVVRLGVMAPSRRVAAGGFFSNSGHA
jgi:hypothetical protein